LYSFGNLFDGEVMIVSREPERKLYLAVGDQTYDKYFHKKAVQAIADRFQLALLVINLETEEIIEWTR
ncbi:MAG: element excision factor XisH family protein, partial [Blastocatellia bacterium]